MKKKMIACALLMMACTSACIKVEIPSETTKTETSAQETEKHTEAEKESETKLTEESEYLSAYENTLRLYYKAVKGQWQEEACIANGVSSLYPGYGYGLEDVGYALLDIDGDGTPELLIGAMQKNADFEYALYTMHTLADGEDSYVCSSQWRDRYYLEQGAGGDTVYFIGNAGSNGAESTVRDCYYLKDGTLHYQTEAVNSVIVQPEYTALSALSSYKDFDRMDTTATVITEETSVTVGETSLETQVNTAATGKTIYPYPAALTAESNTANGVFQGYMNSSEMIYMDSELTVSLSLQDPMIYDIVDVATMEVGDTVWLDGYGITVESIADDNGQISVNDGELVFYTEDDTNGYQAYFAGLRVSAFVGDFAFTCKKDCKITDNSELENLTLTPEAFYQRSVEDNRVYSADQTTIRVEDGAVVEIRIDYMP